MLPQVFRKTIVENTQCIAGVFVTLSFVGGNLLTLQNKKPAYVALLLSGLTAFSSLFAQYESIPELPEPESPLDIIMPYVYLGGGAVLSGVVTSLVAPILYHDHS